MSKSLSVIVALVATSIFCAPSRAQVDLPQPNAQQVDLPQPTIELPEVRFIPLRPGQTITRRDTDDFFAGIPYFSTQGDYVFYITESKASVIQIGGRSEAEYLLHRVDLETGVARVLSLSKLLGNRANTSVTKNPAKDEIVLSSWRRNVEGEPESVVYFIDLAQETINKTLILPFTQAQFGHGGEEFSFDGKKLVRAYPSSDKPDSYRLATYSVDEEKVTSNVAIGERGSIVISRATPVFALSQAGSITLYNFEGEKLAACEQTDAASTASAFSSDGQFLYGSSNGILHEWRAADGKHVRSGGKGTLLAISPTLPIAIGYRIEEGSTYWEIYDLKTLQPIQLLFKQDGDRSRMEAGVRYELPNFSPDGRYFMMNKWNYQPKTRDGSRQILLWKIEKKK